MPDIKEQLAFLRERIAVIDRKWSTRPDRPISAARHFIEEIMTGQVVQTEYGTHFETEKLYERHRRHGSIDISDLIELPGDLLHSLSHGGISSSHPEEWAFLDTETTGLAGGAYAFLIGVGCIENSGFRLRQFFMRDYGEEASLLQALSEHLARFKVLITYNGKAYDQPLLEARFLMARARSPFARLKHFDLLFGARRLWKLRLESCRLIDLESQILGVERQGDLPGEMIPYCYLEYLHTQQAFRLVPIFHHNAMDILSLACLTAIVPVAFQSPEHGGVRHGADLVGLARWLLQAERQEEALCLFRRAVDLGLPDDVLFRTLWDIGIVEKKLGRDSAALAVFAELASSRNAYQLQACEELAKHYEHRERNYSKALEIVRDALALGDSPEIRRREQRLNTRLRTSRSRKRKRFRPAL